MAEKKYINDNLQLMEEWDWEKNNELGLNPAVLTLGSNKYACWICSQCGHKWKTIIANRGKGYGCSICARAVISKARVKSSIRKNGSLAEKFPDIASEWSEHNTISPYNISPGSNKSFLWVCSKGHIYKSTVANRIAHRGCPICSGKRVLKNYNDLFTLYPIAKDIWNFERNQNISPFDYAVKSHKKVWWICEKGHEWEAKISHITDGHGCPYCAGQRAVKGETDIKTTNPKLSLEWDYKKNSVPIETVMQSSGVKYWWKCQLGHSWKATPAHRSLGEGCPVCASALRTSFPEKAVFYYISKYFSDATDNYKNDWLHPFELDIYIPSLKLGIEYDGEAFHSESEKDKKKDHLCTENGVSVIRIREPKCPEYSSDSKKYNLRNLSTEELERIIIQVLKDISKKTIEVDIQKDFGKIEALRAHTLIENSLGESYPELVDEWAINLNGTLTPYNVSKYSEKKVWWRCSKCSGEWQTIVANRSKGSGCPYCANQKVLKGYNDLATKHPTLIKEWHQQKNDGISPSDVVTGSSKKVWWICSDCGYEWISEVRARVKGKCCPNCRKTKGKI